MNKKNFTLVSIIVSMVFMVSVFMPTYQIIVSTGDTSYGYLSWPWQAFLNQSDNLKVPCFIFFGAYIAVLILAIVLLVRSYFAKTDDGDKEDKFFVFGCFAGAIGSAFFALMGIGISSFIPMGLALLYSILYVVAIFIHHRYLSTI